MATGRSRDPSQQSGPAVRDVRRSLVQEQYPVLLRNNRLRNSDLSRLRDEASSFGYRPLVSMLMPVFRPDRRLLERALESVLGQVYGEWELCVRADGSTEEEAREVLSRYGRLDGRIKVAYAERDAGAAALSNAALAAATGEFVGLLGHEDTLAPDALFEVVKLMQEHPGADLVYTDEDKVDDEGDRSDPYFKPGWSPHLLLSANYVSHLSVYRRSLLEEVGGFREGFEGSQDYDLVLRATERAGEIHHVPSVLYHRGALPKPDDVRTEAGSRRALIEALERRGIEGSVESGLLAGSFRTRPRVLGEPKVSLIIPTRDNVSLLRNCVESIERLTTYRNYEIIIIDNDSARPETVRYLASTPHRVVPFREAFNYSRINNLGVSRADGEYVLLLNDDTEVISGGWLEAMLEHAQRPEVGAVGAKLIYPDGRIQHAGVLTGVGGAYTPGIATHSHQFYDSASPGYMGTVARVCDYNAVTAACMLMRRSIFEEVGGLDEENLPVSFNDVDLCLRIRERGYSILYTPYAELYHHESVSRGYKGDPAEALYMRERWGEVLDGDPFYNPHFSRGGGDFNLRADMLRPRVLRSGTGRGGPEDPNWSPLEMGQEELLKYLEAQQRVARDSRRTALVPARDGGKGVKLPPKEESLSRNGAAGAGVDGRYAASKPVEGREAQGPIGTEQLVWMFGSPRTGSTWLSRMMAELDNQERWHEPYIGLLFGSFLYERLEGNEKLLNNPSFIMGEPYRDVWLASIRSFLLEGAAARYPNLKDDQYLVVKEPNGSVGAPLMMEATPESRFIFLIRDPRDVVASRLDAFKEGAWSAQNRDYDSTEELVSFTRHLAEEYSKVVSQVASAYEAHPGKKTLVRYEDLRGDTVATLESMYAELEIGVDRPALEAAVEKHSWENIPQRDKGSGKFYRKASPGGWREDLSAAQVDLIEEITGPLLSRFYRDERTSPQTFSG